MDDRHQKDWDDAARHRRIELEHWIANLVAALASIVGFVLLGLLYLEWIR